MDKFPLYVIFMVFNVIFGLNGLALIGGSLFLIVIFGFNSLIFIMIVIGIIIILIFILGLKLKKKIQFLIMYLIFIGVIFLFYAGISFMIYIFPDILIEYLKSKVPDSENYNFDKINEYKLNILILTCIGAFCSLLSFISCIIYCKKIDKNNEKNKNGKNDGDDILANIDYTILPTEKENREN